MHFIYLKVNGDITVFDIVPPVAVEQAMFIIK
jgi:hypothetical protein